MWKEEGEEQRQQWGNKILTSKYLLLNQNRGVQLSRFRNGDVKLLLLEMPSLGKVSPFNVFF